MGVAAIEACASGHPAGNSPVLEESRWGESSKVKVVDG